MITPAELRWSRYFYCTTLPSLKEVGFPQVSTCLADHVAEGAHSPGMLTKSGKSFSSTDTPIPDDVRKHIVNMKLVNTKKAGVQSNQRATAATAWLLRNSASHFNAINMAWTGAACGQRKSNPFYSVFG